MRLALLFDQLGPYHMARLEAAAPRFELTVLEVQARGRDYAWDPLDNPDSFCRVTLLGEMGEGSLGTALSKALDDCRPELVGVPGWSGRAAFALVKAAAARKIPVVLMSESTAIDEPRTRRREAVKRDYLSLASTALVGGAPHRAYLRDLGMADEFIFEGYDAVDDAYFGTGADRWRRSGWSTAPYFLASNRFLPKKNLFRLIEAYASCASALPLEPWPLVLLGDGEEKPALVARAGALGIQVREGAPWEDPGPAATLGGGGGGARLFLPGFRQYPELPRFYAGAGAFVHASTTEQWGLVVNEAMASGLPVLVSKRCGCAPDLVEEGRNGWTFDPFDTPALAALMARVAALPESERHSLGEAGRKIVSAWGPERFASGLESAARKALEVGPRPAGWRDRLLLELLLRR